MKYIKRINELFFNDRPVVYGRAIDAGQIKPYDLGKDINIYSRNNNTYYDYYDLQKIQLKWNTYCLENNLENNITEISNSADLDYILKYIDNENI